MATYTRRSRRNRHGPPGSPARVRWDIGICINGMKRAMRALKNDSFDRAARIAIQSLQCAQLKARRKD